MFVAIRQYRINPRNVGEITQQVQTGFLPLLRSAPGLIEYNWIDAGVIDRGQEDQRQVPDAVQQSAQ